MATRSVNEVLKPLIETYSLSAYGFAVLQITQSTTLTGKVLWPGDWIFADTTSTLWPLVRRTLLPSSALNITTETREMYEDNIAKALGYPVRWPRQDETHVVTYKDETEGAVLRGLWMGEDACDVEVIALQYNDGDGNFNSCNECRFLSWLRYEFSLY
jgi:hypothetical protein